MTIFFISDTHFSHKNIIDYAKRPFSTVEEMDEFMIARWNETVGPEDHIYHLGDVCMVDPYKIKWSILNRLHGHKRLIRGNHDIYDTVRYFNCGFNEIYADRVIDNIRFTHIPIHPLSMGKMIANVHGHIHEQDNFPPVKVKEFKIQPYINISVEQTGYRPISLEEVRDRVNIARGVHA